MKHHLSTAGAALAAVLTLSMASSPATGGVLDELKGNLVRLEKDGIKPLPAEALKETKVLALYYSAHWCPPCRAFTPDLVAAYTELKAAHPGFELVFISSDQGEAQMKEYMEWGKMPWPALAFGKVKGAKAVRGLAAAGIPYLVVLDAQGNQIAGKAAGQDWVHPREILDKLREILGKR